MSVLEDNHLSHVKHQGDSDPPALQKGQGRLKVSFIYKCLHIGQLHPAPTLECQAGPGMASCISELQAAPGWQLKVLNRTPVTS